MNFFKKPACTDFGYVINVRNALKNAYPDIDKYNVISSKYSFDNYDDLKLFFLEIEYLFNTKIELIEIDKIEGEYDNLPIVYDVIRDKDDFVILGVTPFGMSNLNVLFCELLLYIIDHKIISDGFLHFEKDFFDDYENSYRPFLVMAAVFFGFGPMLLQRHWVSGIYREDLFSIEVLEYKYYIPLDVNILIFAICFDIYCDEIDKNKLQEFTSNYSKLIRKEMSICFSFLEKNGKDLVKESINPFYWRSNVT